MSFRSRSELLRGWIELFPSFCLDAKRSKKIKTAWNFSEIYGSIKPAPRSCFGHHRLKAKTARCPRTPAHLPARAFSKSPATTRAPIIGYFSRTPFDAPLISMEKFHEVKKNLPFSSQGRTRDKRTSRVIAICGRSLVTLPPHRTGSLLRLVNHHSARKDAPWIKRTSRVIASCGILQAAKRSARGKEERFLCAFIINPCFFRFFKNHVP